MITLNLFKRVPKNIKIKMAQTKDELEQAYHIVHQNYVAKKYTEPQLSELHLTYYNMLPQTSTIVAKIENKVIGTLTVINNNSLVLPIERELNRAEYKSPIQSSVQLLDFCMHVDHQGSNVHFLMMKYAYEYCHKYLKVESIQIAASPKQSRFFKHLFGFLPQSDIFYDSSLNGQVFLPMKVNLQDAYDYLAINFGKRNQSSNYFFYFTKFDFSAFFEFPERKFYVANDPIMTPEIMDYFFNYKTSLLSHLDPEELEYIQYLYDSREYKKIIPTQEFNVTHLNLRQGKRFPVSCQGLIKSENQRLEVFINSVAPNGFSVKLAQEESLVVNDIFEAKILIADFNVSTVKAKVVWKKSHLEYGFCLTKSSPNWTEFISYLYRRLDDEAEYLDDDKFVA